MASRLILNSQALLPDSQTALAIERRRMSLGRKLVLRPIETVKKTVVVEINRPYTSINASETPVRGKRITEQSKSKKILMLVDQGRDTPAEDSMMQEYPADKVISRKSRCYSSQPSPPLLNRSKKTKPSRKKLEHRFLNHTISIGNKVEFFEEETTSKVKWKWTERVRWSRRLTLRQAPVVILHFEGVLGDYFNESFWDGLPDKLYLRPGWLRGLRQLSRSMQLVLVTSCNQSKLSRLLALLNERKIKFDAVYNRHSFTEDRHLFNYSQILTEFEVRETASDRVIVISTLMIENIELEQRTGLQLVYEPNVSLGKRWLCLNIPASGNCKQRPFMFLVPNPRLQPGYAAIPFDSISQSIDELFRMASIRTPFSFTTTCSLIDPTVFHSVKKVVLPQLVARKPEDTPRYELLDPLVTNDPPSCLVLPASSCPSKPYVRIDQDLLDDSMISKKKCVKL